MQTNYAGLEHFAIYASPEASADVIAEWFRKTFDFTVDAGKSSILVGGDGFGSLEIIRKVRAGERNYHLAVRVLDFQAAVDDLRARGVELEEPAPKPGVIYLKNVPAGIRVHLICRQDRAD